MLIKKNHSFRTIKLSLYNLLIFIFISAIDVRAQIRSVPPPQPSAAQGESFTWWYISLFVLAVALGCAIYWWLSTKKAQADANTKSKQSSIGSDASDNNAVDADKEMEWLRKNQKLMGKKAGQNPEQKRNANKALQSAASANQVAAEEQKSPSPENEKISPVLPIFGVTRLELARPFDALPISSDEDLLTAVEQAYDEFEEDEQVRELAIRILTAFKTRNSVEALSQVALYDLSSNLRSKAVSVLSEFDHESVFETILLASADPTREVRAAAARGLTKLNFDRADAWTRISETGEEGRIKQTARAAIESGFVDMSFDRLVHPDHRHAYEAFTLMALLIKAGETEKIFDKLQNHRDLTVRRALLHVIKIIKDQKAIDELYTLLEKNNLPIELQEEIDKTIEEIGFVTA